MLTNKSQGREYQRILKQNPMGQTATKDGMIISANRTHLFLDLYMGARQATQAKDPATLSSQQKDTAGLMIQNQDPAADNNRERKTYPIELHMRRITPEEPTTEKEQPKHCQNPAPDKPPTQKEPHGTHTMRNLQRQATLVTKNHKGHSPRPKTTSPHSQS